MICLFVCGGKGVGKDFFLDLSLRFPWDVKVEIGSGFSLEFETSDGDLTVITVLVARAMGAYSTQQGKYIEK